MALSIGLDIGTTSLAAVAVDRNGEIVADASRANDAAVVGLGSGRAEQEPSRIQSLALELLTELADRLPEAPSCLGLTGQMHGVLLVAEDREPLTRLISWQDQRANQTTSSRPTLLETYQARCGADLLERSGCRLAAGYGVVTLHCLREQGELPPGRWKALTVADWLACKLGAGDRVTDRTLAASMGGFDLQQGAWSDEILAAGGLDSDWMPEVRPSGAAVGGLQTDVAQAAGLPAGLPVCGAVGDQQAAFVGSIPPGGRAINLNIGTGGQISWELDGRRPVQGMEVRPLPPDGFLAVGAGVSGGDAYAWLQRTVSGWLRELGMEASSERVYASLNALAAAARPGADGLRCEPTFRGTRRHPDARGAFTRIDNNNFQLGAVARAVLEGIIEGLYSFYDDAGEARPATVDRIIGSGNAFDRNPLLVAIAEERFGAPLWQPDQPEAAARGAALTAGSTTGLWADLSAARATTRLRRARGNR